MYFKKAYCTVNVHTNAPKKIIISLYNLKVPFITIQAHCWSFISGQKSAHAISNEIFFLEMSRPLHELPKLPSPKSKKGSSELYLERAEIKPYTWSRAIHEPPRHQLYHQTMVALDSTKRESVGNLGSTTEHTCTLAHTTHHAVRLMACVVPPTSRTLLKYHLKHPGSFKPKTVAQYSWQPWTTYKVPNSFPSLYFTLPFLFFSKQCNLSLIIISKEYASHLKETPRVLQAQNASPIFLTTPNHLQGSKLLPKPLFHTPISIFLKAMQPKLNSNILTPRSTQLTSRQLIRNLHTPFLSHSFHKSPKKSTTTYYLLNLHYTH